MDPLGSLQTAAGSLVGPCLVGPCLGAYLEVACLGVDLVGLLGVQGPQRVLGVQVGAGAHLEEGSLRSLGEGEGVLRL